MLLFPFSLSLGCHSALCFQLSMVAKVNGKELTFPLISQLQKVNRKELTFTLIFATINLSITHLNI